jgi:hypothetical protein
MGLPIVFCVGFVLNRRITFFLFVLLLGIFGLRCIGGLEWLKSSRVIFGLFWIVFLSSLKRGNKTYKEFMMVIWTLLDSFFYLLLSKVTKPIRGS